MSAKTLALGQRLVVELKLVESTDTLARWMAHYVAELMVRAEHAAPDQRGEAMQVCSRAILDLWAQAAAFPAKRTAFSSIDRVIEVISSLHPDAEPYYRNELWRALDVRASSGDSAVENLLVTALGIDHGARSLIHYVLAEAAREAGRGSAEWLELAQRLERDDPITELRIRLVTMGQEEAELKSSRIEELEKRIVQLEHFAAAAGALKQSLAESLASVRDGN